MKKEFDKTIKIRIYNEHDKCIEDYANLNRISKAEATRLFIEAGVRQLSPDHSEELRKIIKYSKIGFFKQREGLNDATSMP